MKLEAMIPVLEGEIPLKAHVTVVDGKAVCRGE